MTMTFNSKTLQIPHRIVKGFPSQRGNPCGFNVDLVLACHFFRSDVRPNTKHSERRDFGVVLLVFIDSTFVFFSFSLAFNVGLYDFHEYLPIVSLCSYFFFFPSSYLIPSSSVAKNAKSASKRLCLWRH